MQINQIFTVQNLSHSELISLVPLFILAFGAILSLISAPLKNIGHKASFFISIVTLSLALFFSWLNVDAAEVNLLNGVLVLDNFTKSISLMLLLLAFIGCLLSFGKDKKEGMLAELYPLIIFSTMGMILMTSTMHLLFMFIALEIMSLAIYVLVSMRRSSQFSAEAGLKYFILGGLASAIMLYGISLIFGSTGTFHLTQINEFITARTEIPLLLFIGISLVTISLLFKVGIFPFHGWIADVYQGASSNITGFMGAAVKFTAFLAFARFAQNTIFIQTVPHMTYLKMFLGVTAALSMIYGNIVAISQNEIKRMLSYSTIAHSGYLLLGLYVLNIQDATYETLVLYLFFYAIANLGIFGVISQFENKNQKDLTLDDISGLGLKYPFYSTLFTVFLLSMAGIPLTAGFIGKYGLFSAAVNAGEVPLVVIAVLTSVISIYYYLRVIVYLFMKESGQSQTQFSNLKGASVAALISAFFTMQFGLFPRGIIELVRMFSTK
jgi:NADH-quinone oxidoreductase subunit N